jgi:hypothetical protein
MHMSALHIVNFVCGRVQYLQQYFLALPPVDEAVIIVFHFIRRLFILGRIDEF